MCSNHICESQTILVVEDSDDDYEYTVQALKESNLKNPLHRCEDGQEALDYLKGEGRYATRDAGQLPGIILLDLNMPGVDGRAVLKEVKSDEALRCIPIVILTTSSDARDIDDCYAMGANTFIQKPVDLEGFFAAIKRLKEYWFEIAILPKQG